MEKSWIAQRFDYSGNPLYEAVSVVGETVGEATGSAIRVMDYRGWKSGVLVVIAEGEDFETRQQDSLAKLLARK